MSLPKAKDFYDRSLKERRLVPLTTFSFLFGEMVQYMSSKQSSDKDFDLEEKISSLGYPIGEKVLELCSVREKNFKKETKIVQMLQFIHNNVWKMLFGKQADGLQKSTDDEDEYRIIILDNAANLTVEKGCKDQRETIEKMSKYCITLRKQLNYIVVLIQHQS